MFIKKSQFLLYYFIMLVFLALPGCAYIEWGDNAVWSCLTGGAIRLQSLNSYKRDAEWRKNERLRDKLDYLKKRKRLEDEIKKIKDN